MQVIFTAKNGASRRMPRKHAQILQVLGKGTFEPGDGAPKPTAKAPPPKTKPSTKKGAP